MGVTITILSLVVLIPLAALVIYTSRMHLSDIIETITRPRVLASFKVTFLTSLIASIINSIMGVIICAWVLVRYDFPFKRVLDGMIELPFALRQLLPVWLLQTLQQKKLTYRKIIRTVLV